MSSEPLVQPPGPTRLVRGDHVWVASVHESDIGPYRRALEQSAGRLARWNPVDPDDLARSMTQQTSNRRTYLVHALAPQAEHDIVGKINVGDVVRGRFQCAAMGYDAFDPYAGRGLFAEGLRLVLNQLFRPEDAGGMGLHRVQAVVQPGNVRSAGLLRSLGFAHEAFSPRMLWLPGADGTNAWRDHDSYVMLRDEWPARPYATARGPKIVALVNGAPGSVATTLARQIGQELRIPLFSRDVAGSDDALWALLADSPAGGLVQGHFEAADPRCARSVALGLRRAGMDPAAVSEVWCSSAPPGAAGRPLGLGPTVMLDTGSSIEGAQVVRIALEIAAGGSQIPDTTMS